MEGADYSEGRRPGQGRRPLTLRGSPRRRERPVSGSRLGGRPAPAAGAGRAPLALRGIVGPREMRRRQQEVRGLVDVVDDALARGPRIAAPQGDEGGAVVFLEDPVAAAEIGAGGGRLGGET